MQALGQRLSQPKSRKVAIILALLSTVIPLPIAGLHKFYLRQPLWGIIYFLLGNTPMPRIACAIDAVWYFSQDDEQFNRQFNLPPITDSSSTIINLEGIDPNQVGAIASAMRELDRLREEGLISEYEFEQKRRQLLDRIA